MCRFCKRKRRVTAPPTGGEQGSILAMGIFAILGLLAVSGLAIDAGHLYFARLELQKAADAGALGGIGATIHRSEDMRDTDSEEVRAFVIEQAREITFHNLRAMGISVDKNQDIAIRYERVVSEISGQPVDRLSVSAQANINFLLMHLLPFEVLGTTDTGRGMQLHAAGSQAVAERSQANVALVVDTSRSMECPAKGDCSCLTTERTMDCRELAAARGVPTKLDLLKSSISAFVEEFNPELDRISLIPFNIAGTTNNNYHLAGNAVRFEPADGVDTPAESGFAKENFDQALANLRTASATNTCDGLLTAYQEAARVQLIKQDSADINEIVSYVHFTDGTPTAARLLLAAPTNLPPHQIGEHPPGAYDYSNYSIEWLSDNTSDVPSGVRNNDEQTQAGAVEARWTAPSPLVMSDSVIYGQNSVQPPDGAVPSCSAPEGELAPISPPELALTNCVGSFAAHAPYEPSRVFGSEYGSSEKPLGAAWQEQYYNCAIEYADFLRRQGGRFFVIGLGESSTNRTDPYQDIHDTTGRKDIFL
ncbi:MAG: VWA domain-containing protein, partial [Bdellovibrionales bacterium]|nr:VWA domain-containing protein [Bdellovibrionales bacterium]